LYWIGDGSKITRQGAKFAKPFSSFVVRLAVGVIFPQGDN
jgi:hypothetical protein